MSDLDFGEVAIVGGYGQVGLALAAALAPEHPGRIVVAGRDGAKASAAAAAAGYGARALRLDVSDAAGAAAAIDGARVVVMCAPAPGEGFARELLARGSDYVDVTADADAIARIERLDGFARQSGALAVLSVGLAPGLTNLMAAKLADELAGVEEIELALRLGLGDAHGPAGADWVLANLDAPFRIAVGPGRLRRVVPLRERRRFRLAPEAPETWAYRFNFPEQRTLGRTLGVAAVSSWLAIDPPWATSLLAIASRVGVGRLTRARPIRDAASRVIAALPIGPGRFAVSARARARRKLGSAVFQRFAYGTGETGATAHVAANVTRLVLAGDEPPGVRHIEELTGARALLSALSRAREELTVCSEFSIVYTSPHAAS